MVYSAGLPQNWSERLVVWFSPLVFLCALMLLTAGCSRQPSPAEQAGLTPCRLKGVDLSAQCGNLDVLENPAAGQSGNRITIHFAVIPSVARNRKPDPIFIFAGGPGQSATSVAGAVLPVFARLNHSRDLVFVDQRGTGGSHALECGLPKTQADLASALDPDAGIAEVEKCAKHLNGDARYYTTTVAMGDFDAVRQKLGYWHINIWGGSYGTRAALEYLRQFPDAVRSVILDGVAPPNMHLPLSFALDSDAALNRLISDCAADAACHKNYPHLAENIDALFASVEPPRSVRVLNPVTGHPVHLRVTRDMLAAWLRAPLYAANLASLVPEAVTRALHHDFGPLVAMNATTGSALADGVNLPMHLSVVCAEDMRGITPADLAALSHTRFGTSFYAQYQRMCAHWPSGTVPQDFYSIPQTDVPVLLLSGGIDPATPPRHAAAVAASLGNARQLLAPHVGHGISGQGCAPEMIEKFIKLASSRTLDAACLSIIPRPTFVFPLQSAGGALLPDGDDNDQDSDAGVAIKPTHVHSGAGS